MSLIKAKKTIQKFEDFKSREQIDSAFVYLRNGASNGIIDVPTTLHNLYLLCEISIKKLALHYGIPIDNSSHSINTYLYKLTDLNLNLDSYYKYLDSKGRLGLIQTFDYLTLCYSSNFNVNNYPTVDELSTLYTILSDWLFMVEGNRERKA